MDENSSVALAAVQLLLATGDEAKRSQVNTIRALLNQSLDALKVCTFSTMELKLTVKKFDLVLGDALITPSINQERYEEIVLAFSEFQQAISRARTGIVDQTETVINNWSAFTEMAKNEPILLPVLFEAAAIGTTICMQVIAIRVDLIRLDFISVKTLEKIKTRPDLFTRAAFSSLDLRPRLIEAVTGILDSFQGWHDILKLEIKAIDEMVLS